jgi:hypothetical protein
MTNKRAITRDGIMREKQREREERRRLRDAAPSPYRGEMSDRETALREAHDMIQSADTDWDGIAKQAESWRD